MNFDYLIQTEERKILNSRLIIGSATDDCQQVRELLNSGGEVDVNYTGTSGNTPLHCAVSCGNLEIVKLLLENGADVTLENDDIKTPLDIGSSNSNNEILIELQKNVITNSITALQRKQDQYKRSKESVDGDDNQVETRSNREATQLGNESPSTNKEINKKIYKIQSCLKYLKKLNNDNGTAKGEVTYKEANILLFFLEAIVFRDMNVPTDGKKERSKQKKEKKDEVKDYFVKNYYPKSFANDQKVIDSVRNFLFHETNRKITLEEVSKIVGSCNDVSTFFKSLEEYVAYICKNIDLEGRSENNLEVKLVLKSITKDDKKEMGMEGEDNLKKELSKLIGVIYNPEKWHEKAQEILFNFLVNIAPAFQKEFHDFGKLRNKIVHEFYKYEDVDSIIEKLFNQTVQDVRSRVFKCYYAKEVYDILHDINLRDSPTEIDQRLSEALLSFEENFENQFQGKNGGTPKYQIAPQEETEGCFELKWQQGTNYPSFNKDSATNDDHFVRQYLKYMVVVDDSLINDDVESQLHDVKNELMNDKKSDVTLRRENLSSIDKREIFDKFLNLEQLELSFPNKYEEEKDEFKNDLITNYGIQKENLEEIFCLNIETDGQESGIASKQSEEHIINTICALRRFQTMYYKFSKNEVMKLYSLIVQGKTIFEIDKFKKMDQKEYKTENMNERFQNEISMLYKEKLIAINIKGKQIKLNTVTLVSSLFEALYSNYNSYQIKFNNIEEAFKDKMFLDRLLDLEFKYRDSKGGDTFNYYLGTLLKKLLKIDYTAPYIVSLITEIGILDIMEQKDLTTLVEILLNENSYIDFLNDLLKINTDGVDLFKTVCEKLPNQSWESIPQILEEPNHTKKIFDLLEKSPPKNSEECQQNLTNIMNSIVLNLYLKGWNTRALELSNIYAVTKSQDAKNLEDLEALRLKGRIKTREAKTKGISKASKKEHSKVIQIYYSIIKTLEEEQCLTLEKNVLYLLTLSHLAYSQQLLQEFQKSYDSIKKLYIKVKHFALDSPKTAVKSDDSEEDYDTDIIRIMKLKRYCDLLAHSEETKTYLNILKIRESMAAVRISQVKFSPKDDRLNLRLEALKIYKEVYNIHKKTQPEKDLTTAGIMRRLAFTAANAAGLAKNSDVEQSLKLFVEAIDFSTGASKIYEKSLRAHPLNFEMSKLISKTIGEFLYVFSKTKYFAQHETAIKGIKVKYTELLDNIPELNYKNETNKKSATSVK